MALGSVPIRDSPYYVFNEISRATGDPALYSVTPLKVFTLFHHLLKINHPYEPVQNWDELDPSHLIPSFPDSFSTKKIRASFGGSLLVRDLSPINV